MPVEEIILTARFKVDLVDVDEATISEIHRLFKEYRRIVNELIEHVHSHEITSFYGPVSCEVSRAAAEASNITITLYFYCMQVCCQHLQVLHRDEEDGDV